METESKSKTNTMQFKVSNRHFALEKKIEENKMCLVYLRQTEKVCAMPWYKEGIYNNVQ